MRHATVGMGFHARALATLALLGVGTLAALRGALEALF